METFILVIEVLDPCLATAATLATSWMDLRTGPARQMGPGTRVPQYVNQPLVS